MATKKASAKAKKAAKPAVKKSSTKASTKASTKSTKPSTKSQKGLVNKGKSINKINNAVFTDEQKKRIDDAMRGREVHHLTLSINNNFPEERTFEVGQRLGEVAGHKVWHDDIVLALEAYNAEEDKLVEAAKADAAASSSN